MSLSRELQKRSNNCCEMCSSTENLTSYSLPPSPKETLEDTVVLCQTCVSQINDSSLIDPNHWRCLYESMWSEVLPIQVLAYRMLTRLKTEDWAQNLLDQIYLDEESLSWAKSTEPDENALVHMDSNGVILNNGDSVVLIKDLKVKGSSMIAKRGTAVRRITLSHDNANHIEGKVEGQHIVLLTQYVKKNK